MNLHPFGFNSLAITAALALLVGCGTGPDSAVPGETEDTRPFSGIGEDEVIHLTGTEPFWGGDLADGTLTYSTPEDPDGTAIPVERFAGRGGVSFGGELAGENLDLTVTPGTCSDGMSDRTYPFIATLQIGPDQRHGCAWTETEPFEGPEAP